MPLPGAPVKLGFARRPPHALLYQALEERSRDTFHTRVLTTLCWVEWVAGDLTAMGQTARQLLKLGEELGLEESQDFGRYFLGTFHYQRDELGEAERYLEPLVVEPFSTRMELHTHGAFAFALTRLARGQDREARELGEAVVAHLLEIESLFVLPMARAFLAELDLRQGHMTKAARWAAGGETGPLLPMYMFYVPELTQAKAWIAEGEPASLQRAAGLLARLRDYVSKTHNQRFLIEVLAVEALLHDAEGDEPAALKAAVRLAHPAGFVRLFVDLGSGLGELLHRLEVEGDALCYVGEVLASFPRRGTNETFRGDDGLGAAGDATQQASTPMSAERQALPEPLTRRELEILGVAAPEPAGKAAADGSRRVGAAERAAGPELIEPLTDRELDVLEGIAKRLVNKEIAAELGVSVGTVKGYAHNVYQKLGVSGRRHAVARAIELGILSNR